MSLLTQALCFQHKQIVRSLEALALKPSLGNTRTLIQIYKVLSDRKLLEYAEIDQGFKQSLKCNIDQNNKYFRTYQDPITGNTLLHVLMYERMYADAASIVTSQSCMLMNNEAITPIHIGLLHDNMESLEFVRFCSYLPLGKKLPMNNTFRNLVDSSLYLSNYDINDPSSSDMSFLGKIIDTEDPRS